jgi:indole-3-glycerol phosphate synthase
MSNALTPILAAKQEHVALRRRQMGQDAIERAAGGASPPRGFARALAERTARGEFALIAEMKRKSPSGGDIRPGFDPASIARDYAKAGAACLSVLTDAPYFGGQDDDLAAARAAVELPLLRKDFVVDPYQIAESRALGADCILLIVAALEDAMLRDLAAETARFGMDALIEVHDAQELDRALAIGPTLIGINNRNLKTLKTDLATFEDLAPRIPLGPLVVAESGLRVTADLRRMRDAGAAGYLVGESMLRQRDIVEATKMLLGIQQTR